jgi:hypothetical protein
MHFRPGKRLRSIVLLAATLLTSGPESPAGLGHRQCQNGYLTPQNLPETEWGYALPGPDSVYLRIKRSSEAGRPEDYGPRLILVRVKDGEIEELARSRGFMDTYGLRPVFFARDSIIVLLADIGAEYSWGVVAYEVTTRQLKDLGLINVAKLERIVGPDSVFAIETTTDPLPHVRLAVRNGAYIAEFSTDLVVDPGGEARLLPFDSGPAIQFRQDVPEWKLIGRQ